MSQDHDMPSSSSKKPSRRVRAGLRGFSVDRTALGIKSTAVASSSSSVDQCTANSAVFLSGVLEYLVAEIIEIAGRTSQAACRSKILPSDIQQAVSSDLELSSIFDPDLFSSSGDEDEMLSDLFNKSATLKDSTPTIETMDEGS